MMANKTTNLLLTLILIWLILLLLPTYAPTVWD